MSPENTCECGCGQPTPIATRTRPDRLLVAGQPTRFMPGHHGPPARAFDPLAAEGLKRCARCGTVKVIADFPKDASRLSGLFSYCGSCNAAGMQAWVQTHREDWNAGHRRRKAMRRARRSAGFVESVDPLVVLELADGVCGICGEDVDPLDYHVDHVVPLALGGDHSYANTAPTHPRCNAQKGARMLAATIGGDSHSV